MEIITQESPFFWDLAILCQFRVTSTLPMKQFFLQPGLTRVSLLLPQKATNKQSPGKSSSVGSCTEEITQV